MKKLIYTLAFVVIGFTASYAQKTGNQKGGEQATPELRAEKAATKMQKKLNLTAEQKSKVQQIELDRIKKNDAWRKLDETTMKSKMEERKSFMKANKDKLDAVLTAYQKKILESSRNEKKDKMKDKKGVKSKRGSKNLKGGENQSTPVPRNNN